MNIPKLRNLIRSVKQKSEERRIQLIAIQQQNLELWRQNTELLARVSKLYRYTHKPDLALPYIRYCTITYDSRLIEESTDKIATVNAIISDFRGKFLDDIIKSSSPF